MSLLDYLKGPTEEEVLKLHEGRPDDLLFLTCKNGLFKLALKAIELGASIDNCIEKNGYGFLGILLINLHSDNFQVLRNYNPGDELLPEITNEEYTLLKALVKNGLNVNVLLDLYYIGIFDLVYLLLKNPLLLYQSPKILKLCNSFEPTSYELRIKAFYTAVSTNNIEGIDYLIRIGLDIKNELSALAVSIIDEEFETAEALIDRGIDLYATLELLDFAYSNTLHRGELVKDFLHEMVRKHNLVMDYYNRAKNSTNPYIQNYLFTDKFQNTYQKIICAEQIE